MKFIIFFWLSIALVFGDRDLYDVLGVRRRATDQEIKKAYKNLAKEMYVTSTCNY